MTTKFRRFHDRRDAGRALAARLEPWRAENPVVLALPRGGVPVAFEVARALHAPLDVMVVRKLGLPGQPELGMGAIGEGGVRVLDPEVVRLGRVTAEQLAAVEAREQVELERRVRRYRGGRPMTSLAGRTVIIVDDGIATGGTARAAVRVARLHGAPRVVLAVPVAAPDTMQALAEVADVAIALETPTPMYAIGAWYEQFAPTDDDEVRTLLAAAAVPGGATFALPLGTGFDEEVRVAPKALAAPGHLTVPTGARGLVIFAHGSGSSRHSPRNRMVADHLADAGVATLLFDLLSEDESRDRANVFDVELLAVRLLRATHWVRQHPAAADLPVGYFGASTGAAAALYAAAEDRTVAAVVSRGGRPDLAAERLSAVRAPTLLIVGGADPVVRELNEQAARRLRCEHRLVVVSGATHLFEEPGALEAVARHAAAWFTHHLGAAAGR